MHIKVRVKTGAKNESVRSVSGSEFEISVREKPEQNAANRRVVELLALTLHIPATKLHIVKGHRKPSKILSVDTDSRAI